MSAYSASPRVMRADRGQHLRRLDDPAHAEQEQHREPHQHDRTEHGAHAAGAAPLKEE
jgi:hypothetical protein